MRRLGVELVSFFLVVFILTVPVPAAAVLTHHSDKTATTVLDFDDVATTDGWAYLNNSYHGLAWTSTGNAASQWGVIGNTGGAYDYKVFYNNSFDFPSNPNAIYNDSDDAFGASQTKITSTTPFNFIGADFAAWTLNDTDGGSRGASQVTVTGKLGDRTVGSREITLTAGELVWYELDFNNIDTLVFDATDGAGGYRLYVMDDFTIASAQGHSGREREHFHHRRGHDFKWWEGCRGDRDRFDWRDRPHANPIPSAVWLLGSGLIGLMALKRRGSKIKKPENPEIQGGRP